jgi:hypothetical protein
MKKKREIEHALDTGDQVKKKVKMCDSQFESHCLSESRERKSNVDRINTEARRVID